MTTTAVTQFFENWGNRVTCCRDHGSGCRCGRCGRHAPHRVREGAILSEEDGIASTATTATITTATNTLRIATISTTIHILAACIRVWHLSPTIVVFLQLMRMFCRNSIESHIETTLLSALYNF